MSVFIPVTWADVKPYDVVSFRRRCENSTVVRHLLARSIGTEGPMGTTERAYILGEYRTKAGAPHRHLNRRPWAAQEFVRITNVIAVQRVDLRTDDPADAWDAAHAEHSEREAVAWGYVHAFSSDILAASSASSCGQRGWRGPADTVTCPACRELLAQRAQTLEQVDVAIGALNEHANTPANTPAETRTGISDRTAAALTELAELRTAWLPSIGTITDSLARHAIDQRLGKIESLLRGTR